MINAPGSGTHSRSAPPPVRGLGVRAVALAARRLLRALRHGPDRLIHPFRRRAALTRLRRGGVPRSILVLCYGNICRSPYAAERLRSLLRPSHGAVRVLSAGFHESGRTPPREALLVGLERDVEMRGHRSRLLSADLLRDSDLVIVVTAAHGRVLRRRFRRRDGILLLGDLDPGPIRIRAIRDPVEQPVEVFRDVYSRIDRCLDELVRVLAAHDPTPADG
jgi:protein-tyrosine-phosphatase